MIYTSTRSDKYMDVESIQCPGCLDWMVRQGKQGECIALVCVTYTYTTDHFIFISLWLQLIDLLITLYYSIVRECSFNIPGK